MNLSEVGENSEFLSHPSVQPLVEVLEQADDRKYPKASAAQITANVKAYLLGIRRNCFRKSIKSQQRESKWKWNCWSRR